MIMKRRREVDLHLLNTIFVLESLSVLDLFLTVFEMVLNRGTFGRVLALFSEDGLKLLSRVIECLNDVE